MTEKRSSSGEENRRPKIPADAFKAVCVMLLLAMLPAVPALMKVKDAGSLEIDSPDPTPLGYTWSLLIFLAPAVALGAWYFSRPGEERPRKAFTLTLGILVPLGFLLDFFFGNVFFVFPNKSATLGITVPAVGEPIPVEEFVFYLAGFLVVLLLYIWMDQYWMRRYDVPDYASELAEIRRIARFHWPSVILGVALVAAAVVYRRFFSDTPDGFPWYWTYLVFASFVPSCAFFRTARPFINWRAVGMTATLMLFVSLLWEVTLGVPYGWWDYRPEAMMGIFIPPWSNLPLEAVFVWLAVTFTTVIVYEVIKIWLALGKSAKEAFFG